MEYFPNNDYSSENVIQGYISCACIDTISIHGMVRYLFHLAEQLAAVFEARGCLHEAQLLLIAGPRVGDYIDASLCFIEQRLHVSYIPCVELEHFPPQQLLAEHLAHHHPTRRVGEILIVVVTHVPRQAVAILHEAVQQGYI